MTDQTPSSDTPPAASAPPAADTPPASTPPADTPPPADGATPPAAESLLDPNAPPPPAPPVAEVVPEKFRVMKADGTLDESASLTKMAKSYTELEAHKGVAAVPETPEGYEVKLSESTGLKPEEMAEFVKEPMTAEFLKKAHAAGMNSDQVSLVLNGYLEMAPKLIEADAKLTVDAAKAEIARLWPEADAQARNLAACTRAINGFGGKAEDMPGSAKRVYEKYGTDPDFIAFAASVGAEMKEDGGIPNNLGAPTQGDIESLQKSEAYWNGNHPEHTRTVEKVKSFYDKLHGTGAHAKG